MNHLVDVEGVSVPSKIEKFDGEYRWLSNFWPAMVHLDGVVYPTVEHAYQAAKTADPAFREKIRLLPTPGQAKRAGKLAPILEDWHEVKKDIMYNLILEKFSEKTLKEKLLATGDAVLIEGNPWYDTYWGVCRGVGENHLGRILMQVRALLKEEA
jgi:ribA/ribD-fused uncharacterized protein